MSLTITGLHILIKYMYAELVFKTKQQCIEHKLRTLNCPALKCPALCQVTVECTTEASPKAITYWVFKEVIFIKSLLIVLIVIILMALMIKMVLMVLGMLIC